MFRCKVWRATWTNIRSKRVPACVHCCWEIRCGSRPVVGTNRVPSVPGGTPRRQHIQRVGHAPVLRRVPRRTISEHNRHCTSKLLWSVRSWNFQRAERYGVTQRVPSMPSRAVRRLGGCNFVRAVLLWPLQRPRRPNCVLTDVSPRSFQCNVGVIELLAVRARTLCFVERQYDLRSVPCRTSQCCWCRSRVSVCLCGRWVSRACPRVRQWYE